MTELNESLYLEQEKIKSAGKLHWFHWLIVVCSLVLTLAAWYFTSTQVNKRIEEQFERQGQHIVELISERMHKYEDALWSGVATINSQSYGMDFQEWKRFADTLRLSERYPGIRGIGVIYNVLAEKKQDFLNDVRKHQPDFEIKSSSPNKALWPIVYIEPLSLNEQAIGINVADEENRYLAAKEARDTGESRITAPIFLVQNAKKTPGFLLYTPVYHKHGQKINFPSSVGHRQKDFRALVYAPFVVSELMQGTLHEEKRSVGIRISDGDQILYDEHASNKPDYDPDPTYTKSLTLEVYGRTWVFDIRSTHSFNRQTENFQPAMILTGGIIIDCLLLTFFILLARSNQQAIRFSEKMTEKYQLKAAELEEINTELEEFSYKTSHDVRSPLSSIINLTDITRKSLKNNDYDKVDFCLSHIDKTLETLIKLVENILSMTRLRKMDETEELCNVEEVIDSTLEKLSLEPNYSHTLIEKNMLFEGDIHTKKLTFILLIEHLLSNAIKYQDTTKNHSTIKVSTREEMGSLILSIQDNGLGIPEGKRNDLFLMFKKFHPEIADGSGLGLYLVKRSVSRLAGEVAYEPNDGGGSIFIVTIPIVKE